LDVDKSVKGTQSLKEVLSKVTKDTKWNTQTMN
jgi:hypothetical protein